MLSKIIFQGVWRPQELLLCFHVALILFQHPEKPVVFQRLFRILVEKSSDIILADRICDFQVLFPPYFRVLVEYVWMCLALIDAYQAVV